jgi:hypothetical protein
MTLTVRDVDPSAAGSVRCMNCMEVMDVGDVFVSGDCMVCPFCGEWESFGEIGGGEGPEAGSDDGRAMHEMQVRAVPRVQHLQRRRSAGMGLRHAGRPPHAVRHGERHALPVL